MQGNRAPLIRQATEADAAELARLRWDFSPEEVAASGQSFEQFREGFREFLVSALASGTWTVWVAEHAGRLVANVWVQVIHPVPRPGRFGHRYGYITNVYTEPELRGQGIGSRLLKRTIDWARDHRSGLPAGAPYPHGMSIILAKKLTPVGLIPTRALEAKNCSRLNPNRSKGVISP